MAGTVEYFYDVVLEVQMPGKRMGGVCATDLVLDDKED